MSRGKLVFVSISIEDPSDEDANEMDRLNKAIASAKLQVQASFESLDRGDSGLAVSRVSS